MKLVSMPHLLPVWPEPVFVDVLSYLGHSPSPLPRFPQCMSTLGKASHDLAMMPL
jgi:hypothetical protein